ncbi:MAG TPA: D-alanyl-D-alanine carboxypeptidase/D-alanyl-D-alanine-endopeptidase [Baekduia sp.]|uniref:D-alanyl-D-alanine carboxypeptidase/D-alanyl-D-alanine endopeptidase n=1 Tax=Baekduia sp. TaxID=2600305 RepID=UPI002D1B3C10|nr:D-alanyl-D-alanine carboxypeptidase/D-alanyl-D-alanine-endopeptidase [Baekduia sp.]HMJ32837.1 D-alanyl-D-alanine carboxypeptidase/D-alanyl-D-alanine-endopeptidase [Baekduia sp.]
MRRRPFLLLALAALLALAVAAPAQAVDRAGLRSTLAKLQPRMGTAAGAYVVDLTTGDPIYAHQEDRALTPASNEKLFVTATALLRFGPTGTLPTTLRAAPGVVVDEAGVLRGDLYLVGGGDPALGDPGLATLADQLAVSGVTRIDGGVIGDESMFDLLRGGPDSGYKPDSDLGGWLSALSWQHGRSGAGSPALAASTKVAALLKARKIKYERKPRAGTIAAAPAATGAQADPEPLATSPSPTMGALIAATNIPSENFYAEMLAKALGARFGANGSTAAGLAVARADMATFGIHPKLVDGSGLSRSDSTTPRQVVRLLQRMDAQESAATWVSSLPVAGRSGTLRKRMRSTAAAGRCQAKTGTLIGVSALSGYCTTTGGARVAFSLIENKVCNSCAKSIEDRMVSAIARLDG